MIFFCVDSNLEICHPLVLFPGGFVLAPAESSCFRLAFFWFCRIPYAVSIVFANLFCWRVYQAEAKASADEATCA